MNATPLRAQVHADTLSLSDVITSTSATSSPLDELRYRGKATQVDFDFSSFCRHRSRDGGSADLKSSQSWRDEDPGSPVHLAPSTSNPSTIESCMPSTLSQPTTRCNSRSSKLHLYACTNNSSSQWL